MTSLPILDHAAPIGLTDLARDAAYDNFTKAVLRDHPAARRLIGDIDDDRAAFFAFAGQLSLLPGSPLEAYIQAVLMCQFGISDPLLPATAEGIWDQTKALLSQPAFSCRGLMKKSAPCIPSIPMDPLDDFRFLRTANAGISDSGCTLRPLFNVTDFLDLAAPGYADRVNAMELASSVAISSISDLLRALDIQMDRFFAEGTNTLYLSMRRVKAICNEKKANKALTRAIGASPVADKDAEHFRALLLRGLSLQCLQKNWVMQLVFDDPQLTAADLQNVLDLLAQLRAEYALPRVLILCRGTAQLDILSSMLEETDAALYDIVHPLLSAAYGSSDLIAQAEVLVKHSLLPRLMGISSGISSAAGLVWHRTLTQDLCEHFSRVAGKERADAFMRALLVERPQHLFTPARQGAPSVF